MTTIRAINVLIEKGDDIVERATDGDKVLYRHAVKLFEEATRLSEEHCGRLDETTLNSRERLADSLRNAGKLAEAIDCHRENVKRTLKNVQKYQDSSGFEDGLISAAQEQHLYAQRQLAETYLADRNYDKAISTYQAVVDTKAGKSLEDVCKDRVDLASALFKSGSDRNIMEAVNLNIETLRRAEQNLGKSHIETVKVRFNLAKELFDLKKYHDASTRCKELLDILQADRCRARESIDYDGCLKDTRRLLKNCLARIASQKEDNRKRIAQEREIAMEKEEAEARRRAAEQIRKGNETRERFEKEIEAIKKATETEWKGKGKSGTKDRGQGPPVPRKNESQVRNFDESTQNIRDSPSSGGQGTKGGCNSREHSDIRKRAPSPTESSKASLRPDRRNPDTPQSPTRSSSKVESVSDHPRTKDTSRNSPVQSPKTEPTVHQRSASAVSQTSNLTGAKLRELDRMNSTSDRPNSKNSPKRSLATESKTEPYIRPRSASAVIHSSDRTGESLKQSERRNSTRSEVINRSQSATPDKGRRPSSTVDRCSDLTEEKSLELGKVNSTQNDKARTISRDRKLDGKTGVKKAQSPLKSEATVIIQEKKRERVDDGEKRGSDNSKSVREPQTPNGSTRANKRASAGEETKDSDSLITHVSSSKGLPSTPEPNEIQDSEPKVTSNRARPRDEKVSRTVSAPSITVTEHDQEPPVVDVDARVKAEGERPKSSQSNYEVGSSISNTARKREPRSASTGSGRVRRSSETPKDPSRASTQRLRSKVTVSDVDQTEESKTQDQAQEAVDQSSSANAPSLDASANDPSTNAKRSLPPYEEPFFPALEEIRKETLTSRSSGDIALTPPKSDRAQLRNTLGKERRNDDSMSVGKAASEKQSQSKIPPELLPIIRTDTSVTGAERTVPGGWHQDFDEPDSDKKVRRVRSNEQIKSDELRVSQAQNGGHRRSASVDLPQQSVPARSETPIQDGRNPAEIMVDQWFDRLRNNAHVFLNKYKKDSYKEKKAERRVKIAILDSGVAKRSATDQRPPGLLRGPNLKCGTELDPSLPWDNDTKGHGTHAAGLILDVCPYANVYVYRVCQGDEPIDQQHVADAIMDAVDKKKVDIVSMSLGWQLNNHRALEAAIRHARQQEVLLFAASSNEGILGEIRMAYPARAMEVIAIDSANAWGYPSEFNPIGLGRRSRITVPGEGIRSTWPIDLPTDDEVPGFKRLSGTSCATPIAAGIAGLLLEFARQRPMCFDPRIEAWLKRVENMRLLLENLLSRPSREDSFGNMHLNLIPTELFHCTQDFPEGGDWAENRSPRLKAAYKIADMIDQEHGGGIGLHMDEQVQEEVARRRRESV